MYLGQLLTLCISNFLRTKWHPPPRPGPLGEGRFDIPAGTQPRQPYRRTRFIHSIEKQAWGVLICVSRDSHLDHQRMCPSVTGATHLVSVLVWEGTKTSELGWRVYGAETVERSSLPLADHAQCCGPDDVKNSQRNPRKTRLVGLRALSNKPGQYQVPAGHSLTHDHSLAILKSRRGGWG